MSLQRRSLLALAAAACAGRAWSADAYPSRAVTLYVANGPGGAGDIVARAYTKEMTLAMHQAVVIENRPAPMIAPQLTARAKPDGYTLMAAGGGTALTTALFRQLPYDLQKDFVHVSTTGFFNIAFLVADGSPFKSMNDVIAFAKAHPGQLNIGSIRLGSTQNLVAEMFKARAGIDVVVVPYRTTADLVTATRTKDVGVIVEIVSPILSQIASKVLRPLAITSAQRYAGMPAVPTVAETIPGFEATSWTGVSAPAGTPPEIVAYLNRQVNAALAQPAVQKIARDNGMLVRGSTPQEMAQAIQSDIALWRGVIDKAGIPLQ